MSYAIRKDDQGWRAVNGPDDVGLDEYYSETPIEIIPATSVPSVVTMRQARLALLQSGLLAQVNTAVAAADEATKITWEFSTEVHRENALVATLASALGLTESQLDDLFTLAATL